MSAKNPKKRLTELPDAEALAALFPPEVLEMARRVAHEKDGPTPPVDPEHPTTPLPSSPSV
jgi:hypothetical protein